ncbi:MAG: hypothetical protein WA160_12230 [Pseudobdellovibrio sp.]
MFNIFIGFCVCGIIAGFLVLNLFSSGVKTAGALIGITTNAMYGTGDSASPQNGEVIENPEVKEHKRLWESVVNRSPGYLDSIKILIDRHTKHSVYSLNGEEWREIEDIAIKLLNSKNATEVEEAAYILRDAGDLEATHELLKLGAKKKKYRKLVLETLNDERKHCAVYRFLAVLLRDNELNSAEKKIAREVRIKMYDRCNQFDIYSY